MKKSYKYYFEPKKIIRDLAHGYVNLTEFDLRIINTSSFQRLKDIRQLTCQEVYPSARHTRFEHSLGVLELTRQAIKHLNMNKFIPKNDSNIENEIISKQLQLNAAIAALLHDIGHCMFSHLGEKEFNENNINNMLIEEIESFSENHEGSISELFINYLKGTKLVDIGSKHEKISCLVILSKFENLLLETDLEIQNENESIRNVYVDFELIIRSILRIRYTTNNSNLNKTDINKYNVVIHLINDRIFDMDKLDYIMRDTIFTGINVAHIDTKRLFKNIYFEDNESYGLVFSSKAVPALQNFIDARDGLYMYVYNHHTSVLADSLNSYIIRRLARNADKFVQLVDIALKKAYPDHTQYIFKESVWEKEYTYALGLVPRNYIFSIESIIDENRSDSDWISLINTIYTRYSSSTPETIKYYLLGLMEECFFDGWKNTFPRKKYNKTLANQICSEVLETELGKSLVNKLQLTYKIISNYKSRTFLKPWWKTLSQFVIFLERNYKDVSWNGYSHEDIRNKICKMITYGTQNVPPDQLRAQIAQLVMLISKAIYNTTICGQNTNLVVLECLEEGDFFIGERSNRFNEIENIRNLKIVMQLTELEKSQNRDTDNITKSLDDVIPQKDYSSIYNRESFYIYSKPLSKSTYTLEQTKKHYNSIEKIFVFSSIKFLETSENQLEKCFSYNADENAKTEFFAKCIDEFCSSYRGKLVIKGEKNEN